MLVVLKFKRLSRSIRHFFELYERYFKMLHPASAFVSVTLYPTCAVTCLPGLYYQGAGQVEADSGRRSLSRSPEARRMRWRLRRFGSR